MIDYLEYITTGTEVEIKIGENKMQKLENIKTETYKYNNVIWVDIVETENEYEAYIDNHDYDTKWYIFGIPKKQQTKEEFIEIVEYNIPEYLDKYEEIVYKNNGGYKIWEKTKQ